MKKVTIAIAAMIMTSSALAAGDAEKGKAKAATCAACHGANGVSAIPMYPNLAGQKEAYLLLSLIHI